MDTYFCLVKRHNWEYYAIPTDMLKHRKENDERFEEEDIKPAYAKYVWDVSWIKFNTYRTNKL